MYPLYGSTASTRTHPPLMPDKCSTALLCMSFLLHGRSIEQHVTNCCPTYDKLPSHQQNPYTNGQMPSFPLDAKISHKAYVPMACGATPTWQTRQDRCWPANTHKYHTLSHLTGWGLRTPRHFHHDSDDCQNVHTHISGRPSCAGLSISQPACLLDIIHSKKHFCRPRLLRCWH